jgi:hypothetical protein
MKCDRIDDIGRRVGVTLEFMAGSMRSYAEGSYQLTAHGGASVAPSLLRSRHAPQRVETRI